MINKAKAICFTGHRSAKLPQTAEELATLKLAVLKEIDKAVAESFDTFLNHFFPDIKNLQSYFYLTTGGFLFNVHFYWFISLV